MLIHVAVGPLPSGRYLVARMRSGCTVLAIVEQNLSRKQALEDAERLNKAELDKLLHAAPAAYNQ